jgi:hypothetical protein
MFDWSDKSLVAAEVVHQLHSGVLTLESAALLQAALFRGGVALVPNLIDGAAATTLQQLRALDDADKSLGVKSVDGVLLAKVLARRRDAAATAAAAAAAASTAADSVVGPVPVTARLFVRVKRLGKLQQQQQQQEESDCRVHFAEIDRVLTLVIVSSARPELADEELRLARIRGYLRSRKSLGSYLSFFEAKVRVKLFECCSLRSFSPQISSPISLSYVNQLPGLVHFIVIDRSSHRMLAPGISELYGEKKKKKKLVWKKFSRVQAGQQHANKGPALAAAQQQLLRRHLWRLRCFLFLCYFDVCEDLPLFRWTFFPPPRLWCCGAPTLYIIISCGVRTRKAIWSRLKARI